MLTQILGLCFFLLAVAAVFYLWAQALNDRSKPAESDSPDTIPPVEIESVPRARGYSLAPNVENDALARAEPAPDLLKPKAVVGENIPLANLDQVDIPNDVAKTHLEIGRHFFETGDFEGAVEMATLVMDNPDASSRQKESALLLQQKSA
ncbi:hypothetical protein [Pseudomonas syringae]|uniref:hypothetical protein n=1 Tax=Pseudomonas syringae TaxID=317 RepID=UPI001F3474FF|nr:hypothetical protein [Pseudomonas syringae]MCF5371324.1 hypothetical protein [Pseudomonas syringae]MCF5382079.1 hypothetical protein [Pseudomonas syringae]MCF5419337.1 hypothetical protein [Pseudomonas syringae]MCF5454467.1 hypothetical protein [Pseudomonas syringae]MCF5458407.1 hypothetical protein [Pseudomonas syringae]